MVDGYYDRSQLTLKVFLEVIGLKILKINSIRVIFEATLSLGASFTLISFPI
jgi:hypothetical protein